MSESKSTKTKAKKQPNANEKSSPKKIPKRKPKAEPTKDEKLIELNELIKMKQQEVTNYTEELAKINPLGIRYCIQICQEIIDENKADIDELNQALEAVKAE